MKNFPVWLLIIIILIFSARIIFRFSAVLLRGIFVLLRFWYFSIPLALLVIWWMFYLARRRKKKQLENEIAAGREIIVEPQEDKDSQGDDSTR